MFQPVLQPPAPPSPSSSAPAATGPLLPLLLYCGGNSWGGRDQSICFSCGSFLHKKLECRSGHRCGPRSPTATSNPTKKAPSQDISSSDSSAFSSYKQPAALHGDIETVTRRASAIPSSPHQTRGGVTGSPDLPPSPSPHPNVLPPQGSALRAQSLYWPTSCPTSSPPYSTTCSALPPPPQPQKST